MSARKIIDPKHNGEKVWLKSHAQAIYMSDGTTVEDKITSLESSGTDLTGYVKQEDLATVATSGSYNDLSNKPTIPSAVTESTVSGWGFTKNAGTVTGVKANGTAITLSSGVANIPAASTSAYGVTKLSSATNSTSTTLAATASAVKAAYDLANSYKGTVTSVKINGTTKSPSSGVVDLGTVITSHQTLKTINGESIIGSGDITISGGESGSYTGNAAIHQLAFDFPVVYDVFEEGQYEVNSEDYGTFFDTADVGIIAEKIRTEGNVVVAVVDDHDGYQLLPATVWFYEQGTEFNILVYSPYSKYWYEILMNLQSGYQSIKRYKNYIEGGSSAYPQIDAGLDGDTFDIVPNTFYVFGEKTDLDISFIDAESSGNGGKACEYLFQFTSGSEGTTLVLNDDIKWASELVIEPNKIYQISILNGLGTVMSWDNSNLIAFSVLWGLSGTLNFECEKGMTWEAFVASSYNTDSALRIYNGNILYRSYRIQDVTPTTIIENGKVYTSIYVD